MTQETSPALRLKPLLWSGPQPPNAECRYDHAAADTSLGRYQIEWKSWKQHDAHVLYFAGDYIDSFASLADAKEGAAQHLARTVAGVVEDSANG